jgi:opacity protein-like surface antigen
VLNLHRIRPVLSIAVLAVLAIGAPSAGAVVGRVNLDGTEANPDFINTPRGTTTWDVAVDAGHIYWTWSNRDDPEPSPGWIARANLDGSAVQPQFISGVGPGGLAVANGRLYWANADTRTIGRANVDGSGVDPSFISSIGDDAFDVEATPATCTGPGMPRRAHLAGRGSAGWVARTSTAQAPIPV